LDSGCACSVYVMAPKGRKKAKGTTVDLAEFLAKTGQAPQNTVATTIQVRGTGSWADEVDDDDVGQTKQIFLPTAPRAAMEFNDDHVPYSPPFTARIANLSYDTDEEQVKECFERARLKVQTVRLMKDAEAGGRLKGYGYIDFFERESLVDALQMQEISMNNRKVRIDLATGAGKDRGGGGFGDRDRRGGFGDRGGERGGDRDPDAGRSDAGDWRSAPAPPMKEDNRSRGGFDRYDSDRGGDRGFGGFRDRGDRDGDRRGGGGGGFDNYRRRSPEPVKERPRIVLQPRSAKKEEEEEPAAPKPVEKSSEQPRGSIFGSAKPVDTTAKEKEIEEKMGKMEVKDEPEKPGVYRPPGARGERSDDRKDDKWGSSGGGDRFGGGRRDDRDRRDNRRDDRGYDRRDDRGYDRRDDRDYDRRGGSSGGGYRDDRGGYDRRDDRGGYDRNRNDRDYDRRRDDRDYDRRDNRDYDRRDDRDVNRRRDDRDADRRDDREPERRDDREPDRRDDREPDRRDDREPDRRDDREPDRRDDREPDRRSADRENGQGSEERDKDSGFREEKRDGPRKPMKKLEESKPVDVVAKNKFAYLQDDEDVGSGEEADE